MHCLYSIQFYAAIIANVNCYVSKRKTSSHHGDGKCIISLEATKKSAQSTKQTAITLMCLSIGTPKIINFPFVPNGKFIIFRCPKI